VLVCGGVLLLPPKKKISGRFSMPQINGQLSFPIIVAFAIFFFSIASDGYFKNIFNFDFSANMDYLTGKVSFLDVATPNISLIIFWGITILLAIITIFKKYSLIPLMGVTTCLYLLTGMTKANWAWFLGWLALGLIFYFVYGYKNSVLAK